MDISKLKPVPGKVLIRKDKVEDKTSNGIILGINDKGRCLTGTRLDTGERIVIKPGITSVFDVEGDRLTLIFEHDIIGLI